MGFTYEIQGLRIPFPQCLFNTNTGSHHRSMKNMSAFDFDFLFSGKKQKVYLDL